MALRSGLPGPLPRTVAITGTNGKSTTTTFCHQLLSAAGVPSWAGGNLGTPLSELAATALTRGSLGERLGMHLR